ncbi:YndM family protein [Bacillus sp. CGMCC 1.16541]|uniref:YndM family protein n=1 Tax=Bacillus sp. CGMCC 1.16541 TaxID=2185143 RepID=UPI000D73BA13|nr:YndM family protein [Bacillus sp. CGMCC 1.16541]
MKHVKPFLIKFLFSLLILYIVLGSIFGIGFPSVFIMATIISAVSYVIGDDVLLPKTTSFKASLADLAITFFLIWFFTSNFSLTYNAFTAALMSATGLAIADYFFHRYIRDDIMDPDNRKPHWHVFKYQTEMAEELTPVKPDVYSDEEERSKLKTDK